MRDGFCKLASSGVNGRKASALACSESWGGVRIQWYLRQCLVSPKELYTFQRLWSLKAVWNEDVDLVCPSKRCLLVTFQVAEEPFAASGNWEDQKVRGWVSGLFLDRKSLLIFPNEPHLFPIAFSKRYPCSILVLPSYDKNVNIIIVAILLLYFRLNLALLHHKHVGFACSRAWGLIPFLPLADCKLVILPSLVSIPSSVNWK